MFTQVRKDIMWRASRSRSGFSLIEVIVAVALMGIVTLGFATMLSNIMAEQKIAQARNDITAVTNEMQMLFSNSNACQSGLVAGAPFDIAKAQVEFPPPIGAAFQFNGQPFKFRINNRDTLEDGATLNSYGLIANRVQIVNAGSIGVDISSRIVYRATVIGQFSPKGTNGHGLSDFAARPLVSGYVSVTGGTIAGCSLTSMTDLSQLTKDCQALGGRYDASANKCLMTADVDNSLVSKLCGRFGGSYENGNCKVAASGGGGGGNAGHWAVVNRERGRPGEIIRSSCPAAGTLSGMVCVPLGATCMRGELSGLYDAFKVYYECK